MTEFVVFGYLPNDGQAKTCTMKYEELDEMTKIEFEMMSLAGSYLEVNGIDNMKYPNLQKILTKWKLLATEEGDLVPLVFRNASPRSLFETLKLIQVKEDSIIKYCILLSDKNELNCKSTRVFWSQSNEPSNYTIDCKSDEIKKCLKEIFGIADAQLSNKNYAFIYHPNMPLIDVVVQFNDKQLKFIFV